MNLIRDLADHDLNERLVRGVKRRQPAIEFLRARDVEMHEQPDEIVLEYAASHSLLVVSHDVNTMRPAAKARIAAGLRLPGLLLVPQTCPIGPVIDDLVLAWGAASPDDFEGLIQYLPL